MKHNYQKELDNILINLQNNSKPKLLLHACCGPCSSYVLEYLSSHFDITVLFYNPNIYPSAEYKRRLSELKNFYKEFPPVIQNKVKLIEEIYNPDDFYSSIDIINHPEFANEKEKGNRCHLCYKFRLKKTFEYAEHNNFDFFCTTLSISPFKDSLQINEIGEELCKDSKTKWLFSDFKKSSGFLRSLQLSKEYNLYRQDYCGCIFSLNNSSEKKN